MGKHTEAIICYDEALKINPNYSNALYNKGIALNEIKRYEEAIVCYNEVIRVNPNESLVIMVKVIVYMR